MQQSFDQQDHIRLVDDDNCSEWVKTINVLISSSLSLLRASMIRIHLDIFRISLQNPVTDSSAHCSHSPLFQLSQISIVSQDVCSTEKSCSRETDLFEKFDTFLWDGGIGRIHRAYPTRRTMHLRWGIKCQAISIIDSERTVTETRLRNRYWCPFLPLRSTSAAKLVTRRLDWSLWLHLQRLVCEYGGVYANSRFIKVKIWSKDIDRDGTLPLIIFQTTPWS